jgi:hypothetical protein
MTAIIKKEVSKIYESSDYDSFVIMKENRKVTLNSRKVEYLRTSMHKFGQLIPGIINEKNEIIDGQHRLYVAKLLSIPFKFLVCPGLTIREVLEVNNSQKAWVAEDYLQSYVAQDNENYKLLDRFHKNFDKLSLMNVRLLFGDDSRNNGDFSEGLLKIDADACCRANKIAILLYYIADIYPKYNKKSFVKAIITLVKDPGFKEDVFIAHLSANRQGLYDCVTTTAYLKCLQDLYNRGLSQKNRIVLV